MHTSCGSRRNCFSHLPRPAFYWLLRRCGGRMTAQRTWREALTRHVIAKWLDKDRFRHLNHLTKGSENPEYRIGIDIRIATDTPVDMALAFLLAVLTAITFFSVMWTIGGSETLSYSGRRSRFPDIGPSASLSIQAPCRLSWSFWQSPHWRHRTGKPDRG